MFDAYSNYYDLLYEDKNYAKEVEFVSGIIRHYAPDARTILDLGCGTGIHALGFAQKGYQVTGVDRSADMLAKARARSTSACSNGFGSTEFVQADIRDFKLNRRFDVVVSLFHVMGYLPKNSDLEAAFARVVEHLEPGGLLIFDHWYGPAVLTDRPAPRIKTFENDDVRITRFATPSWQVNDNLVTVRYDLVVVDKATGRCEQLMEKHTIRFLFWPEIQFLLSRYGLEPVEFREWLSEKAADETTWNAFVAAVRPKIT